MEHRDSDRPGQDDPSKRSTFPPDFREHATLLDARQPLSLEDLCREMALCAFTLSESSAFTKSVISAFKRIVDGMDLILQSNIARTPDRLRSDARRVCAEHLAIIEPAVRALGELPELEEHTYEKFLSAYRRITS